MIRAAVLGHPISQSLSPKLHGYWLKAHGIDGSYEAIDVSPEKLEAQLDKMVAEGWAGCNITVPHKEAAFAWAKKRGRVETRAEAIGAINTLVFRNKEIQGFNTDIHGFIHNLKAAYPQWDFAASRALVLGAGGAARGVVAGLIEAGCPLITLTNRTRAKAEEIRAIFASAARGKAEIRVVDWESREAALATTEILVNTTILGMQGQEVLDLPLDLLSTEALVTDIVYKPLETPLLKSARARGNKVVDGLGMLLHQAAPGFEMWFGKKPEVTAELRKFLLA